MTAGIPIDLGLNTTASATSLVLTTNQDTPGGRLSIVFTDSVTVSTDLSTLTDASSNGYTVVGDAAAAACSYAFSANALAIGPSTSITASFNGAAGAHGVFGASVPGIATSSPRDAVPATSTGTAAAATAVLSGTLAQGDEILFGMIAFNGAISAFVPGGNWVLLKASDTNAVFRVCYQIVSSTTSVSWAPTWTTSRTYVSRLVSFKGDGLAPPTSLAGVGNGGGQIMERRRQYLGRLKPGNLIRDTSYTDTLPDRPKPKGKRKIKGRTP